MGTLDSREMSRSQAHQASRSSWPLLVVAAVLAFAPTAGADRRPGMREARTAARAAVLAHPTYRTIVSEAPLVTRSCRRASRSVRCRLHRWAPDPCALDGRDGPCVQVLTRRIWHVRVTRRSGRTIARVVRVSESSSAPYSESARNSS
jgi:hypothetical protein